MRIKEEDINRVRQETNIVDIIGQYLSLQKSGRNYLTLCPFHNDTNPSMTISTDKQIYKCFVCGAGGNVFSFLQNYQHLSFPEAVIKVAEFSGITLDVKAEDFIAPYDEKTQRYFDTLEEAINYSHYQLNLAENQAVKDYLLRRGISQRAIDKFKIGYNPKHQLSQFLLKKGISRSDLIATNLLRFTQDADYDVFSNRILFPIFNHNNKPVAFSGRALDNDQPKYVNTAETDVYVKGNILYNYYQAKTIARKEKLIYLVEGVIDVIAFDEAGIENVVATLGTALTKQQISLLKQLTNTVYCAYDGDEAGQLAAYKAGVALKAAGFEVFVVNQWDGLDPDEYRHKFGNDALIKVCKQAINWIEFLLDYYLKQYDLNNYDDKKHYAVAIMKHIDQITDSFDKENFIGVLSKATGFEINSLKSLSLKQPQKRVTAKVSAKPKPVLARKYRAEYEIINQMLYSKEAYLIFKESLGHLINPHTQAIALIIADYYLKYDKIVLADFISYLNDHTLEKLLLLITELETIHPKFDKQFLKECIQQVKADMIDLQIKQLQLSMSTDLQTNAKLADEIIRLKLNKQAILKGE